MRPLREWITGGNAPVESGPIEPLAVLSAVTRERPRFDPELVFDRAMFGLEPGEVRSLGPIEPHLLEVAWEALERSGIPLDNLRQTRVGTYVGSPGGVAWTGREGAEVAEVIGLPGAVLQVVEPGASALLALHVASLALRAWEIDVALVLTSHGETGVAAAVLGRLEQADPLQCRLRSMLIGSAVVRIGGEPPAQEVAARRAARPIAALELLESPGLGGLVELIDRFASGEDRAFELSAVGETVSVSAVFTTPEHTTIVRPNHPLLTLSARSTAALVGLAQATVDALKTDDDLAGMAGDSQSRPAFEHRVAVPTRTGSQWVRERLQSWVTDGSSRVASGRVESGGVAYVIPPAGAQFAHMAEQLYTGEPVFREALNRCDRALRSVLPRPLLSVLFPAPGREVPVDDPLFANPLTVSLAWCLSEVFRASRGVHPAATLGCGVGEIAAAVIARAITLESGLRLAAERGRLLRGVEADCARAVIGATEEWVTALVAPLKQVDIVAVPMPGRVVIGGAPPEVDKALLIVRERGARYQRMAAHPAHTPLADGLLEPFREAANQVEAVEEWPVQWFSAATGQLVESAPTPAYWVATLRAPLRFAAGVEALYGKGMRSFVELAARPTMAAAGSATLSGRGVRWLSAMIPGREERVQLDEVAASLWVRGVEVDRGDGRRPPGSATLPTYRWDRRPLDDDTTLDSAAEATSDDPTGDAPWVPDLPPVGRSLREPTLVPDYGEQPPLVVPRPGPPRSLPPIQLGDPLDAPMPQFVSTIEEADGEPEMETAPEGEPELEDVEVEAYSGTPLPLAQAQERADTHAVWVEDWEPYPLPEEGVTNEPATWVVLADADGVGDYAAALLARRHHRCIRVLHTNPYPRDDGILFVPDPSADGAWDDVVDALGTLSGVVRVLHLWTLDIESDELADPLGGWASVLQLLQDLHAQGLLVRLQLVTRGAAIAPDPATAHSGGALWGAGRWAGAEVPEVYGGLVDLDPDDEDPEQLVEHLLAESPLAEGVEVAFRGGERLKRVVSRREGMPEGGKVDIDGAWLLCGDVDAPLVELAGYLAEQGVIHVYLVSPQPPPGHVLRRVLGLQRSGVMCIVVRADVSVLRDRELLAQRMGGERLAGVVVRVAADPMEIGEVQPKQAAARWTQEMAAARALEGIAGERPMWVWSEGRSMLPVPMAGLPAVTGASLDAAARARIAAGKPTTVIHAAPAELLAAGQAARLVGRLGPVGGVFGVWKG